MKGENKHSGNIDLNHDFFLSVQTNSANKNIILINEKEFAIRFWLFEYAKKKNETFIELKELYNPGILSELKSLGFYKRYDEKNNLIFIKESKNVITEVNLPIIRDSFYEGCIKAQTTPVIIPVDDEVFEFSPEALHKTYLNRHHLIFNKDFLQHLDTHEKPILRDEKYCSFIPFKNFIIKTSSDGIDTIDYTALGNRCVWDEHIINHIFEYYPEHIDCHFANFISNVSDNEDDRIRSFESAIGYLIHNHNRVTGGQVVIAYDQSPALKGQPPGGTGKGVFINAIRQIRNVTKIDGKKYRSDDKFKWQNVSPTTQVVWLDDVHSKFPFEDLHSTSTDGWNIERKYAPEFYIPPSDSPKIFLASNTIMTNAGTTNKRRQFILEFSDHYSRHIKTGVEEPIKTEHGCTFFDGDDWNRTEWNKFYSYLIDCSVFYHAFGLETYEFRGLKKNQLLQSTSDDFAEWIESKDIVPGEKYKLKELFEEFKLSYYGDDSEMKQRTFTSWLKIWAGIMNMRLEKSKSNGEQFIMAVTK